MVKHKQDSPAPVGTAAPGVEGPGPGTAVEVLRHGPAPQTTVSVPLNQDHLIAVVISEAETRLAARLNAATAGAYRHAREAEHKRTALRALILEAGARGLRAHVAEVVGPVRRATGLKVEETYAYGDARADRRYPASVEAAGGGDGKSFRYTTSVLEPMTPRMVELAEEIEGHEGAQRGHTAAAADSRRRLQQIPQLERRARAKLAKVVMAQTPEGRDLYDRLVAEIDDDADALPVLGPLARGAAGGADALGVKAGSEAD